MVWFNQTKWSWSSPSLIVPKPNSKKDFQMMVDVYHVNEQTMPTAWPMPNLEVICQQMKNTSVYALFDLFKGYWQLPLDTEYQETIFHRFFKKFRHYNLKLNAPKSLFSLRVKLCGRIILADGISQDPTRVGALTSLAPPITSGDLQQFGCALNWMRITLPHFAEVVSPLQRLLEDMDDVSGKWTKKAVPKVLLREVGWKTLHSEYFQQCKSLLAAFCTHAHPKADYALCIHIH